MLDGDGILEQKTQLLRDAVQWEEQQDAPEWLDTAVWPQYMAKNVREKLYRSFTDRELTAMLQTTTDKLGRLPSKRDVFCMFRFYIIRRYGNWPKALVAAGLKRPRRERRMENRCRQERAMPRRNSGTETAADDRKSEQYG